MIVDRHWLLLMRAGSIYESKQMEKKVELISSFCLPCSHCRMSLFPLKSVMIEHLIQPLFSKGIPPVHLYPSTNKRFLSQSSSPPECKGYTHAFPAVVPTAPVFVVLFPPILRDWEASCSNPSWIWGKSFNGVWCCWDCVSRRDCSSRVASDGVDILVNQFVWDDNRKDLKNITSFPFFLNNIFPAHFRIILVSALARTLSR